jgi:hypothetical protein
MAARHNWKVYQMDVVAVFLATGGDLYEGPRRVAAAFWQVR